MEVISTTTGNVGLSLCQQSHRIDGHTRSLQAVNGAMELVATIATTQATSQRPLGAQQQRADPSASVAAAINPISLQELESALDRWVKQSQSMEEREEAKERITACYKDKERCLNLSKLDLSSLPSVIGRLTHVTTLSLAWNQLTSLPSELGQLTRLDVLDAESNQLASIPEGLELKMLKKCFLSKNQLRTIPSFSGMLRLRKLNLSNNPLEAVPDKLRQRRRVKITLPKHLS